MNRLDVLNACLGSMGEAPLNSVGSPHAMRPAALSLLDSESKRIQAIGRWYNMEDITLQPDTTTGYMSLPGDAISFRSPTRNTAIRNGKMYDLENGTPIFTEDLVGRLIRLIAFDELPESAAQYIGAEALLKFQMRYDGDSTKTRQLALERDAAKIQENIDHIRNRKSNFIQSNVTLQRLKSLTNGARRYVRP